MHQNHHGERYGEPCSIPISGPEEVFHILVGYHNSSHPKINLVLLRFFCRCGEAIELTTRIEECPKCHQVYRLRAVA